MNVGVVGLGIMGTAMTRRLIAAGHEVTVWNRTREKATPLVDLGAVMVDSPAEVAKRSDVVITMVTNPNAVRDVALGESGILQSLSSQAVHCEMSTVLPSSAKAMAEEYAGKGKRFVQAPVLGSKTQIEQSTLLVVAGGDHEAVELGRKAWKAFSTHDWEFDRVEQASGLKLAANMLIAQMIMGLGQTLILAKKFDIDPRIMLDVIDHSALASPMYRSKGKSIVEGNFAPNFVVSNLLKDLTLATDTANEMDLKLPFAELAKQIFAQAAEDGYANQDYSAVVKTLAEQAGVQITP